MTTTSYGAKYGDVGVEEIVAILRKFKEGQKKEELCAEYDITIDNFNELHWVFTNLNLKQIEHVVRLGDEIDILGFTIVDLEQEKDEEIEATRLFVEDVRILSLKLQNQFHGDDKLEIEKFMRAVDSSRKEIRSDRAVEGLGDEDDDEE